MSEYGPVYDAVKARMDAAYAELDRQAADMHRRWILGEFDWAPGKKLLLGELLNSLPTASWDGSIYTTYGGGRRDPE